MCETVMMRPLTSYTNVNNNKLKIKDWWSDWEQTLTHDHLGCIMLLHILSLMWRSSIWQMAFCLWTKQTHHFYKEEGGKWLADPGHLLIPLFHDELWSCSLPHFMVSCWKEVSWHTKWREWIQSTLNNRGHIQLPSSKSSPGLGWLEDRWTSGGKVRTTGIPSVNNWEE